MRLATHLHIVAIYIRPHLVDLHFMPKQWQTTEYSRAVNLIFRALPPLMTI